MRPSPLFTREWLADYLAHALNQARSSSQSWSAEYLLSCSRGEIRLQVEELCEIDLPLLDRKGIKALPVRSDWRSDGQGSTEHRNGHALYVPAKGYAVTVRDFLVPFSGSPELLAWRPQRWSPTDSQDLSDIVVGDQALTVSTIAREQVPPNAEVIRSQLFYKLERIEAALRLSSQDLGDHARGVLELIDDVLARRNAANNERELEDAVGFPVRRRIDASKFVVPLSRKRIEVTGSKTSLRMQHWIMDDAAYEEALRVLINSRNALERSPSLTRTLREELIRDLLLLNLNAQFKGAAGRSSMLRAKQTF